MFSSDGLDDNHPQCTFPARFAWLKKQLNFDLTQVPKPDCDSLNKWRSELNAHQVSLIFPSSYLNNPSSMFGHTFLRFDPPNSSDKSLLMAYSINFAAYIPNKSKQISSINYIYKGLFGGFPTESNLEYFYKKLRIYADNENRDIWEYRLNLTSEELEIVVLHMWELKDKTFDYFFLDENCSYRVIALLAVAFPDFDLTDNHTVYAIPVDTIRTLKEHGIIESKKFRASAIKTLLYHAEILTTSERILVLDIVKHQLPLDSSRLLKLPKNRKVLVLALASEYLTILINQDVIDRKMSSLLAHKLLTERAKRSNPVAFDDVPEPFASPDMGHKRRRLFTGSGYIDGELFYAIEYRNNYHSLLDPISGFDKGAQIEYFNLEVRGSNGKKMAIEHLSIMNVISLAPINEFFKPTSWSFSLGAKRKLLYSTRPLLYSLEFERGISYSIGKFLLSEMVNVSFDINNNFEDGYGLGVGLNSYLLYQGLKFSSKLGITTSKYILGDKSSLYNFEGEISFSLNSNNQLFSGVRRSLNHLLSNDEVNFGYKYYY